MNYPEHTWGNTCKEGASPNCVAEQNIPESAYQSYWDQLKFPREFTTTEGDTILVINGGSLNQNAGPDFKNATVIQGDKVLRGDIEIHINAMDWKHHGHGVDPRYANVILHVVASDLAGDIQSELRYYPGQTILLKKKPKTGKSSQSLRRCEPEPVINWVGDFLKKMGWRRIVQKATGLARDYVWVDEYTLWYQKILRVLGYGANSELMESVAERLPLQSAQDISLHLITEDILDFVLGFTGFREYFGVETPVWDSLSEQLKIRGYHYYDWHPLRSRPANHPVLRLSTLLCQLPGWLSLYKKGPALFSAGDFIAELCCPSEYISHLRNFFPESRLKMGTARAVELIVNVYVPLWLLNHRCDNVEQVSQWVQSLPKIPVYGLLQRYPIRKASGERIMKPSADPLEMQGMLWFERTYCRQDKCQICPILHQNE